MIYAVKTKLDSEKMDNIVDIINDEDKVKLEQAIDNVLDWLQDN
jgi:hypothetical protein